MIIRTLISTELLNSLQTPFRLSAGQMLGIGLLLYIYACQLTGGWGFDMQEWEDVGNRLSGQGAFLPSVLEKQAFIVATM